MNKVDEILSVASGNKALQVDFDTQDLLFVGAAVFAGMLLALIAFEGFKYLLK